MTPNLRSLVAKAYRFRQGRTFSSSSSAPNPNGDKGGSSIVRVIVSRGVVMFSGFTVAFIASGNSVSKFDEKLKSIDKEAVEFLVERGKLPPDAMYKS